MLCFTPSGSEMRGDCPFCSDRSGHLYVNAVKGVYYCHRCGRGGPVSDLGEAFGAGLPPAPPEPSVRTAPPDRLHAAYSALLGRLSLSEEHRKHLMSPKRGMPEAQIEKGGYRTLPPGGRIALGESVARFADPSGVPGFYLYGGKKWCVAGPPGLLIPVRDWEGRILGIQVRPDVPKGSKYCWLSSAGRPGGTPAKARWHASVPEGALPGRVWITEGPLKADISSAILGEAVVAVPGANAWRGDLVKNLVDRGFREAVVAFDADARRKPGIRRSALALKEALLEAGLEVFCASWEESDGNGLDDLLLSGRKPEVQRVTRRGNACLNRVTLIGYLLGARSLDLTHRDGTPAKKVLFYIKTSRNGAAPESLPVTAWDGVGEGVMALEKGRLLLVEGRLKMRAGISPSGRRYDALEVVASSVEPLGSGEVPS